MSARLAPLAALVLLAGCASSRPEPAPEPPPPVVVRPERPPPPPPSAEPPPPEPEPIGPTLMDSEPRARGPIREQSNYAEPEGLTEVTLSSGARVVLYPIAGADRVVMVAWVPGGLAQLQEEASPGAALEALETVRGSHLGPVGRRVADRTLAAREAYLEPVLSASEAGFVGEARSLDLRILFEAMHLYLRSPQGDRSEMRAMNEDRALDVALDAALLGADPAASGDPEAARAAFQTAFSDVAAYTVVLAGGFDLEVAETLARRYLDATSFAALAPVGRDGAPDRLDPGPPVTMTGAGPALALGYPLAPVETRDGLALRVGALVLQSRLGALPGARDAAITLGRLPGGADLLRVRLTPSGDPRALAEAAEATVAELLERGPTAREVADAVGRLDLDVPRSPESWAAAIADAYRFRGQVPLVLQRRAEARSLTAAAVRSALRDALDTERVARAILSR